MTSSPTSISIPAPPFKHAWTVNLGAWFCDAVTVGERLFVLTHEAVVGIDLSTGAQIWKRPLRRFNGFGFMAPTSDHIYVIAPQSLDPSQIERNCRLMEIRTSDGKVTWNQRVGHVNPIAIHEGSLYTPWKGTWFVRYDLTRRRVVWKVRTSGESHWRKRVPEFDDGVVLFSCDMGDVYAADDATGKVLWHLSDSYSQLLGVFSDIAVVQYRGTLSGRAIRTGETLWTRNEGMHFTDLRAKMGMILEENGLHLLDPTSGSVRTILERSPIKEESRSYFDPVVDDSERTGDDCVVGEILFTSDMDLVARDMDGNVLWRCEELRGLNVLLANGSTLVLRDNESVYGYVSGESEPIPVSSIDRRALAERMASQIDSLTPQGFRRLAELAPESAEPLLLLVTGSVQRYERLYRKNIAVPDWRRLTQRDYLWRTLATILSPVTVPHFIAAFEAMAPNDETRSTILHLIAKHPDAEGVGPFLMRVIESTEADDWVRDIAMEILCDSRYEPGNQMLLDLFEGPSRRNLYTRIARIGERGANALIDFREREDSHLELWPGVIRLAETDAEKALEAAFDCEYRFAGDSPSEVHFPERTAPFVMRGARGTCYTSGGEMKAELASRSIGLSFDPQKELLDEYPEGSELTILVTEYWAPLAAHGNTVIVKKFASGWAPIDQRREFVS